MQDNPMDDQEMNTGGEEQETAEATEGEGEAAE